MTQEREGWGKVSSEDLPVVHATPKDAQIKEGVILDDIQEAILEIKKMVTRYYY